MVEFLPRSPDPERAEPLDLRRVLRGDEAGPVGMTSPCAGEEAVAGALGEQDDRQVALQVGLLVDGELRSGPSRTAASTSGEKSNVPSFDAARRAGGGARPRPTRVPSASIAVDAALPATAAAFGAAPCGPVVDRQHASSARRPCASPARTPRSAGRGPVAGLLVDAHRVLDAGGRQPLARPRARPAPRAGRRGRARRAGATGRCPS